MFQCARWTGVSDKWEAEKGRDTIIRKLNSDKILLQFLSYLVKEETYFGTKTENTE